MTTFSKNSDKNFTFLSKNSRDNFCKNKDFKKRFDNVVSRFEDKFLCCPSSVFSSPGRIEIVGNHTDHNGGKVLTATIDRNILVCVNKTDDAKIIIWSDNFGCISVNTKNLEFEKAESKTSIAIVKGVADYYIKNGYCVGGFNAYMSSDIPIGAGVSSSSAFEMAIAEILNVFYNKNRVSNLHKALASQYAENKYFGKPCGLMDQLAISQGAINMIDFKIENQPKLTNLNWTFESSFDIFIINTGGSHANLIESYASILNEMKSIANFFGKNRLCEIDKSKLIFNQKEIFQKFDGRSFLRSVHFYEENERVEKAYKSINGNNIKSFLESVNDSGLSSWTQLQNLYTENDKKQNIPYALSIVKNFDGCIASRVHGGGFAGTILVFVEKNKSKEFSNMAIENFGKENTIKVKITNSGTCEIARLEEK